ncbi:MAG: DUF523 domain-containing protein [Candidatus Izemoplasmatales bacterium]|nr:DUF523 domain-containing protein [Candidatus Izemoplasmatales bacterium]
MPVKDKVALSACLLGIQTAYDGKGRLDINLLAKLKGRPIFPICPEVLGGLPTPRIPSEIQSDTGKVLNREGQDVTEFFSSGAKETLRILIDEEIRCVYLKDNSPSCGFNSIYDGTFSNRKIQGEGITCKFLKQHGISVIK